MHVGLILTNIYVHYHFFFNFSCESKEKSKSGTLLQTTIRGNTPCRLRSTISILKLFCFVLNKMHNRASVTGTKHSLITVERGTTTMWRRNKLYTKGINMSAVVVAGLLALLLATQSSNGQVDRISAVTIPNCQVRRFPAEAVAECQIDQIHEVEVVDDSVDRIPAVMVIADDQVDRNPEVAIEDGLPGPWISELFYQALSNFKIQHVGSFTCRTQSDIYARHLRNHTSWAVRSEYIHFDYIIFYQTLWYLPILLPTITMYKKKEVK